MIKIAETRIDKQTLDAIYKNWRHHASQQGNPEILDETDRLRVQLRVAYQAKGDHNHMTISSELKVREVNGKLYLALYSSWIKPIVVPIIVGILAAILFHFLNRNILFAILFPLGISSVYSAILYSKMIRTGERFLSALKEHSI